MKTQCNLNTNPLPNNSFRLMMKKHETGETEFLPVAGAGSRRSTDFTSREC